MANPTMIQIATQTLGSTTTAVTFSSIPSTYTDLMFLVNGRSARTNDVGGSDGKLEFNGVTTSYSSRMLLQQGGAFSGTSSTIFYFTNSNNATASTYSNLRVYVPNYLSSNYKTVGLESVDENNGSTAYFSTTAGLWSNTAAITSATFTDNNGGFLSGSTFYLYGIKNS